MRLPTLANSRHASGADPDGPADDTPPGRSVYVSPKPRSLTNSERTKETPMSETPTTEAPYRAVDRENIHFDSGML